MGEFDVQWDTVHTLGLLYMHARHYAPTLGRFLQPDPDGSEDNLYAYAANSPVTEMDPDGTCFIILCIAVGVIIFGGLGAGFGAAKYATGTELGLERSGSLAEAAGNGFIDGGLLAVPAPGLGRAGRVATKVLGKALTKVPKAARVTVARAALKIAIKHPILLRPVSPRVAIRVGQEAGWTIRGSARGVGRTSGQGVRILEPNPRIPGAFTGHSLRWHPGGGHHGPRPYWKPSAPNQPERRIYQ